ncbi:hypothetical protein RFM98_21950 [Mesorhizobium sp. VK9D]|uniref:hypothetical protein n=1 Tax=Mesorhizobium australafricanum TaxID=3072311 RepID=UPI002A24C2AA|nr:hypothetical protein [Mesorhizobium sp. VK9D]MDX8455401.1 hypothetical protein [Mesorhizobium sp. VK9D]
MRVKIAAACDGACFGGGKGIGVTGVKRIERERRLGRGRRIAGCNEMLDVAVMTVDLDGCDRHGSEPATGRYRPERMRPAPTLQRTTAADTFAFFGPRAFIFLPLHDGLLLLRTNGARPEDQRTEPFIPGGRLFSFTPM